MKTFKKALSLILSIMFILSCFTLAFAEENDTAQIKDCITWEVKFSKDKYNLIDTATVTVKLTNNSENILINTSAEVTPYNCMADAHIVDFGTVPAGESRSVTCNFMLAPGAPKLNFFAKLLLMIKSFFVRGMNSIRYDMSAYNINASQYDLSSEPKSSFDAYADFNNYGKVWVECKAYYDVLEVNAESIAEAVEKYNAAAEAGIAKNGTASMSLVDGSLKMEGSAASIVPTLEKTLKSSLSASSYTIDELPGNPPVNDDDVAGAMVETENGKTKIVLLLNGQTDGYAADAENGGAVSRGTGTMDSLQDALDELGMEINSGEETISLVYSNPIISKEEISVLEEKEKQLKTLADENLALRKDYTDIMMMRGGKAKLDAELAEYRENRKIQSQLRRENKQKSNPENER